ncbi:hypothetical protein [Pseudoalteromonas sp.]|jgi:hypothetical protein|uniref:hypothetical protein n=1 Tax=Pseudoalteromonas sp. TaxID=53249 RepID=UPI002355B683|nr:hypothetical protein [Pseudoalteromonas sp.]
MYESLQKKVIKSESLGKSFNRSPKVKSFVDNRKKPVLQAASNKKAAKITAKNASKKKTLGQKVLEEDLDISEFPELQKQTSEIVKANDTNIEKHRADLNAPYKMVSPKDGVFPGGTLQGRGHFFKGGGAYASEIKKLRAAIKLKLPTLTGAALEQRVKNEILLGTTQRSEFIDANMIGMIGYTAENERSAVNLISLQAAMEAHLEDGITAEEVIQTNTVFGKGKMPTKKKLAEKKAKMKALIDADSSIKSKKAKALYLEQVWAENMKWYSTSGDGGSKQSQIYKSPNDKRKRKASYDERVTEEKNNIVKKLKRHMEESDQKNNMDEDELLEYEIDKIAEENANPYQEFVNY